MYCLSTVTNFVVIIEYVLAGRQYLEILAKLNSSPTICFCFNIGMYAAQASIKCVEVAEDEFELLTHSSSFLKWHICTTMPNFVDSLYSFVYLSIYQIMVMIVTIVTLLATMINSAHTTVENSNVILKPYQGNDYRY